MTFFKRQEKFTLDFTMNMMVMLTTGCERNRFCKEV